MNDSDEIQRLLRLKRYETPGEDYFQKFLEDFKDRQRAELLHRSARGLLAERFSMWFSEYHGSRWLIPAGSAAALVFAGFFFFSGVVKPGSKIPGDAGLAGSASPSIQSADLASSPGGSETINLQLPRPNSRVPGTSANALSGVQGILPVGVRGTLREL